jgi:hypothetical protein
MEININDDNLTKYTIYDPVFYFNLKCTKRLRNIGLSIALGFGTSTGVHLLI